MEFSEEARKAIDEVAYKYGLELATWRTKVSELPCPGEERANILTTAGKHLLVDENMFSGADGKGVQFVLLVPVGG